METDSAAKKRIIRQIIRAYGQRTARLYSRIRFLILHHRFLDEIGQYLPDSGLVLDVGCGYGLSAQYFAMLYPDIRIRAMDVNARRIERAAEAARKLRLTNVEFRVEDVRGFVCTERIQGAYMLDLIHHVPHDAVARLIEPIAANLEPGRRLIIKDVVPRPLHKLIYTWLLDKFVDYRAPVRYWTSAEMRQLLESVGFRVYQHNILEYLPSPHVVYLAVKERDGIG